jgi:crotonobetainyl-CoA:carnitine CoA-transferase CaiB-like acyl-CoA transferase
MSPVAVMDFSAGMHATVGILAALFGRERGGKGAQYIDVSLLESGVAMLGYKMIAALLSGGEQPARGVRHKGFFPGGVFETADGWLQLTVGTDADFTRFCHATDRRDLLADDRYLTRWTRTDNHVPLMAEVRAMFKTEPTESWVARLNDAGVMAGGVLTLKEASEHEQIRARNAIVQIPHAAGGVLPIVANPIRNAEWEINYLSPPLLGADSDYILSQLLDLAPSEIDHLREVGALAPFARDVLSKPEASHGS